MITQIVWFKTKEEALKECKWAIDAFEIIGGWVCFSNE
jgi:hypothetical protein